MNINELKERDPKRFEREYAKWREWQCCDSYWAECVQESFTTDMALLGLHIEKVWYSIGYCQSDYASFEGRLNITQWMKHEGYDVPYQAMWLALCDYGDEFKVDNHYKRPSVDWELYYAVGDNTEPSGIFADLPQDAWCELVESQMAAENWPRLIDDWLRDKAHDLYKSLRDEYEYQTSEEMFIERCECNEVEFDDEGEEE